MKQIVVLLSLGLAVGATPAFATSLYAFATSTVGQGDMSSWDEVAGANLQGLAAADGICQAHAAAASLEKPSHYVAWLSDRNTDAYCRIFGLIGKKSDNCGQLQLPVGAGPWLRVDGVPFANTIEKALSDNLVYSPLNVDEFGNEFHTIALSFTATDIDGTFNTELEKDADCNQWTSAIQDPFGPFPTLGSNLSTGGDWTYDGGGVSCDGHRRLMCMQKGSVSQLSGHAQFGHAEAFVTSADVTGNLGGIAGADATCQSLATSANLYQPSTFKALLASYSDGVNVTERIQFNGPWYRRDGLLFAHDKAELTGGAITLPLNITESGEYLGISIALTGASHTGAPLSGLDCGGWALSPGASQASGALANSIAFAPSGGTHWLDVANVSCSGPVPGNWPRRLFCLSDSDVIFHSEFEDLPVSP